VKKLRTPARGQGGPERKLRMVAKKGRDWRKPLAGSECLKKKRKARKNDIENTKNSTYVRESASAE